MNKFLYTIKGKTDGFGSQYQAIMSGIAFCEYNGNTYFHTPFCEVAHEVGREDELNKFIGINNDDILISEEDMKNIEVQKECKFIHLCKNPSLYYNEEVIKKIKDFYYSTEKPKIGNIDIAIHIRRGDVSEYNHTERHTSNAYYKKIIELLKKKHPSYNITIFSQGKIDDFKELELEDSQFNLNVDIKETFHSLVSAKVLVTSKSSFSYAAAILNENVIYYENFWHKPFEHWLKRETLLEDSRDDKEVS